MKRKEWEAIKFYIDSKIDDEFDRRNPEDAGDWCGEPTLSRAEKGIEEIIED